MQPCVSMTTSVACRNVNRTLRDLGGLLAFQISSKVNNASPIKDRPVKHQSTSFNDDERPDFTAKRSTAKCDPYGQSGKGLNLKDAERLLKSLDEGWKIIVSGQDQCRGASKTPPKASISDGDENTSTEKQTMVEPFHSTDSDEYQCATPLCIQREYTHLNFMIGTQFVSKLGAICHVNNHYAKLTLQRQLLTQEKQWRVVTTVECSTPTLDGLSYNDFHLALLIDTEVSRLKAMLA